VHRDYVVCLDCGWRGQMLRRHVTTAHGLTVEEYRARWNLLADHAMTAPRLFRAPISNGEADWFGSCSSGIGRSDGTGGTRRPGAGGTPATWTTAEISSNGDLTRVAGSALRNFGFQDAINRRPSDP
jgi:hypothetical protein